MLKKINSHNYVIHYNQYTQLWHAIPRDVYQEYWNNDPKEDPRIITMGKLCDLLVALGIKNE
jgi:hypothetical protein